ncbi:Glycosyl transferase, group 1 [Rhodopseudomonas palustris HaA2]|uniref:Glycosyl transferase, group 1 n=1 Tax=Rhodopseudomonas palustris (strain HaA2) TaxID=316058 RepID=Q2IZW1_RHOP2|nr:glycosyltransferase [Rhodopseudomonas palustris]ABD06249.1 Glycosyl transferase, group 1 [Rhodopseudomonas palustris HaA2]
MKPLSVVHLAQSDSEGGANKAAYRIHKNLQTLGLRSTFHVGRKLRDDPSVVPAHWPGVGRLGSDVVAYLNARTLRSYPHRLGTPFSPSCLRYGHLDRGLIAGADVVCAHWIAGAFLNFGQLKGIAAPLVWRLSDIWPFSGGCHYPGGCSGFERACGGCPQLGSTEEHDLSRRGLRAREAAYGDLDLTIVAPSRWIAGLAGRSSLFGGRRIEHIPTGVDLQVFRPRDRLAARHTIGLPESGTIVLFGALSATDDPRKGYAHLLRTIENLAAAGRRDLSLVVFGGATQGAATSIAGYPVHHLGSIGSEERLAEIYSAADVLIAPFLEDNLPNVVLEAVACGTPVAAFAAGGIPDAIDHQVNGYLASTGDDAELARGVASLLDRPDAAHVRSAARRLAETRFDLLDCARRYIALFEELAEASRSQIDKTAGRRH